MDEDEDDDLEDSDLEGLDPSDLDEVDDPEPLSARSEALLLAMLDHPHAAADIAEAFERDPEALFADLDADDEAGDDLDDEDLADEDEDEDDEPGVELAPEVKAMLRKAMKQAHAKGVRQGRRDIRNRGS